MDTVKMKHYFTKSGEKMQRYKCRRYWRIYVPNPILGIILKNLRRW
jgi:hypothetical protein